MHYFDNPGTDVAFSSKEYYKIIHIVSVSYQDISKEVGYHGYMRSYPSQERMEVLFENLCAEPTDKDFKTALRIFRFAPEARTAAEIEMICKLDLGLVLARKTLNLSRPKWSLREFLKYHVYKLIPTLSLFYLVHLPSSESTIGLF